jgi:methionyl-tRNA formyltransferase
MDTLKEKSELRIIFLGNPEFARYHLEQIILAGYQVVAVISAPDKPAGRGQKLYSTPVTQYAREQGIPLLQPKNLKNPEFLAELESFKADLQIVIAFRMLPEVVWNMPQLGTLNLHASLLPAYRGAAPINWAIINGEQVTGVSTFLLKHEIDTGDILIQKKHPITPHTTAGVLHDDLMELGAKAILETLAGMLKNSIAPIPQSNKGVEKVAPKIFTEDCILNFNQSGDFLYNKIRGLSPYPTARCRLDNKNLKIYFATFEKDITDKEIGKFYSDGKSFLKIGVLDGFLNITDLQLEGKKRMKVDEFLRGYRLNE